MSLGALTWALYQAPVTDAQSVLVLLALADRANDDGTSAYPSVSWLAARARCSERTVHRHLRLLEQQGVIARGDQQMVAHFRSDRRPTVWDIPGVRGAILSPRDPERGDTGGTHGVTPGAERGDTGGRQYVLPPTGETVLNPSSERGVTSDTPPERERDLATQGPPSTWRRLFTSWPEQRRGGWVSTQQAYRSLVESGYTEEQIAAAAEAYLRDCASASREVRYIKMLGTFLRDSVAAWVPEDEDAQRQRITDETIAEYIEKGWTHDPETGKWLMPEGGL